MKISEMNTTSFADFITASGDHLANILQNEQIIGLFSGGEKKSPIRFVADAASILMGDCREDVFAVLGAINGKSAEKGIYVLRSNSAAMVYIRLVKLLVNTPATCSRSRSCCVVSYT